MQLPDDRLTAAGDGAHWASACAEGSIAATTVAKTWRLVLGSSLTRVSSCLARFSSNWRSISIYFDKIISIFNYLCEWYVVNDVSFHGWKIQKALDLILFEVHGKPLTLILGFAAWAFFQKDLQVCDRG